MSAAPRLAFRFAFGLVVVPLLVALGGGAGCGPTQTEIWICLNPITGKLDESIYDANHYVNGKLDPCHCYDPCGSLPQCPIEVDAGPPPSGCDDGGAPDGDAPDASGT